MKEKRIQEYAEEALRLINISYKSGSQVSLYLGNYVPVLNHIYRNGYTKDILESEEEFLARVKLIHATIFATLINREIFRHLLEYLLFMPVSSIVKLDDLKGIIKPLSYDELYYALDFIDDDTKFLLLSSLPNNEQKQLLDAFQQQDKQKFVTIASHLESDTPCYEFFASVLEGKDISSQLLRLYDGLMNQGAFSMAISKYPFSPSAREFEKRIDDFNNIDGEQKKKSGVRSRTRCCKTSESSEQSASENNVIGTIDLSILNSNRKPIDPRRKLAVLKSKVEDFVNPSILSLHQLVLDTCIYIRYISSSKFISPGIKEQLYSYIKKYDIIFKEVDFDKLTISQVHSNLIFKKLSELCLIMVRNHKEEKENSVHEPVSNASEETSVADVQISSVEVEKACKANLGRSPYIDGLLKKEGEKYHLFLDYLYDYLTAKIPLGVEPNLNQPLIDCTKEDFMYVLGDTSIDKTLVSDVPAINWIEVKLNMIAFFEVLYMDLTTITRKEKRCCYLYNGENVQLSANRKKSEPYKPDWERILKSCMKVVANQKDIR